MIVELPPPIPAQAKLADRIFFKQHADRRLRIRPPIDNEYLTEFRNLGYHELHRRRVIVFKIPPGLSKRHNVDYGRIPFILFADETVEDRDDVLHPILDRIMKEAR